ncbi:hypothetical protein Nepgr_014222 [Nepenthes gracilis]|uniref:RING-type E3 ubiquitin transferase n=1 Tax=Nepenthes gracilis TaxID=150966 RepID=A0AAD3SKL6_NEPGR|nr:hypothetical protein Nepgr_014222 [Nepenthes gracilis]
MAFHCPQDDAALSMNSTAVAIDKDKNSLYAVRWTIDHLLTTTQIVILVHVRHKNPSPVSGDSGGAVPAEADVQQLFVPYRGYCARKSVQLKEVILDDIDVAKALVDYITSNCITNIVVGASTRNALMKTFKKLDVASSLSKSAPDFCSVYVIAKGKVLSVRSAQRPVTNTAAPPKLLAPHGLPHPLAADYTGLQDEGAREISSHREQGAVGSEKNHMEKGTESNRGSGGQRPYSSSRNSPTKMNRIDVATRPRCSSARSSFSDDDLGDHLGFRSTDMTAQTYDFSVPDAGKMASSSKGVEEEMRRLRLELKQTMDMYGTACREAISAKKKAKELSEWKMEEAQKFEQARLAGEAALAIAEVEKAKCKAAIEAAEAAQKIAEMEAQKRRLAERKARRESEEKDRALTVLAHNDVRYRKYTIDEIETATEKFSAALKIGEGGYGPVYKGKLDHTPVAIKVLRPDAAQGRKQFHQEVEVLCCIRHPHMVLLLGACPDYGCLVYEYMDNGSLEDRLFRRRNTPPIHWRIRFKIAAEIATALTFLHQAKPEPLVHRDLKPANILLDRNYVSKISDVGLARLVPPSVADSVTQYHMTSAAGTFCYIDPEYQQTGMLTTKSDIYSLGIMLLQLITARPPMALSHHVQRAIEKGTFEVMLDPTVALKCAELRKKDRPSLAAVVLPELNRLRDLAMGGGRSGGLA